LDFDKKVIYIPIAAGLIIAVDFNFKSDNVGYKKDCLSNPFLS
jgi:hypothetical protein